LKQVVQANDLNLRDEAFKVSWIQGENVPDALRLHGGDQIGIVDLFATHRDSLNQLEQVFSVRASAISVAQRSNPRRAIWRRIAPQVQSGNCFMMATCGSA